jgi:hypothetical protein
VFTTWLRVYPDPGEVIDGNSDSPDLVDGGDADGDVDDLYTGGLAQTPPPTALLHGGPWQACTSAPVRVEWFVGAEEPTPVQLVLVGTDGQVALQGPTFTVVPTTPQTLAWELPYGVEVDGWRPGLVTSSDVFVGSTASFVHPLGDPIDCVVPYMRTLPAAVCTSGPTVVETNGTGCVELVTVEWVWEVTSPWRYGPTSTVLAGLNHVTNPTLMAPGVAFDLEPTGTQPASYCPTPPVAAADCSIDPGTPLIPTAPAPPTITSPTAVTIGASNPVRRYLATIGPEQTPPGEGLFTLNLTAGTGPVVGARVRVYEDTDPGFAIPEPCAFAYEYLIDYIPAGGILTIGGPGEQVATLCDGATRYSDARGAVRGSYGGPLIMPHARCNRRYLIVVDQLDTYPRTVTGFYTSGQAQGRLTLAVAVTGRES